MSNVFASLMPEGSEFRDLAERLKLNYSKMFYATGTRDQIKTFNFFLKGIFR